MTTAFAAYFPRPARREVCPSPDCAHPTGVHGQFGCYASAAHGWVVSAFYHDDEGRTEQYCYCMIPGEGKEDAPSAKEWS